MTNWKSVCSHTCVIERACLAVHARWATWIWHYSRPFTAPRNHIQTALTFPSAPVYQLYPGASPGYVKVSQPPSAHSFLSVVLQPRRQKQVLLNRQAEQVDRAAVPENESHTETLITQTTLQLLSYSTSIFIRSLVSARKYGLFQKGKPAFLKSKSH